MLKYLHNIYFYDKIDIGDTMREIIFATSNKGKVREVQDLLPSYKVLSLSDIGYEDDIVENGTTFKENALIKALTISKKYHKLTISDDSGLEVFSLNNEPGIYSARYATLEKDDEKNNQLLIKNLQNKENTDCRYVCAIAIVFENLESIVVEDYCYGKIIFQRRGENGFGYDPYFYLPEYSKTMAELPLEVKNKISHRGKALKRLLEVLDENFDC